MQAAAAARRSGLLEAHRLLASPEDLARLPELIAEHEARLKAAKSALSALTASQVEAARSGIDAVDRTHRAASALRGCLDTIATLAADVPLPPDALRRLSITHGNVSKVLSELKDIIDLPDHAAKALAMLDRDPGALVATYTALTVLEGTADNAKAAWHSRGKVAGGGKVGGEDAGALLRYLDRVAEACAKFESILWANLSDYETLAQEAPSLLVDCLRVVEMQEKVDAAIGRLAPSAAAGKGAAAPPAPAGPRKKAWRRRLLDLMASGVAEKFAPLLDVASKCGEPNKCVRYTADGDVVVSQQRDYLGTLTSLTVVDSATGVQATITDAALLRKADVIEEEMFDEDAFMEDLLPGLYGVEADLADVYDTVSPCFPPSYAVFETLFQMYHVHVATVVDTVGQRADKLSTGAALRVIEFVQRYLTTVRGFGVDDALARLPRSPATNPDLPPGIDMLMGCTIERMEKNVRTWYSNILVVDLEYEPQPGPPNGALRTPGVTDFFRILNEEMEVIRGIDDAGGVMFATARCALGLMRGFQAEQSRLLKDYELPLSFEMSCAMMNNAVECYDRALAFVEEVAEDLKQGKAAAIAPPDRPTPTRAGAVLEDDVDTVCRGFLDVAKEAARRIARIMFNDPGVSTQLKVMFTSSPEWLEGRTMGVLLATLTDYMGDVARFVVDPGWTRRVAEAAFDELARKAVNIFIAGIPPVTAAMVGRMAADEDGYATYFGSQHGVKPDRLAAPLQQLTDLRMLLEGDTPPVVLAAYESCLGAHAGFTPEALEKVLDARGTFMPASAGAASGKQPQWEKKYNKQVLVGAREAWKRKQDAQSGAAGAGKKATGGFFAGFWGSS